MPIVKDIISAILVDVSDTGRNYRLDMQFQDEKITSCSISTFFDPNACTVTVSGPESSISLGESLTLKTEKDG